ncbi:hypothetical protein [Defluviimonas sp. WL0075]|uniref:Uncharacterized protein n=1 Tax=Albidovulum sediminicola TaxID=2984331 RepID=A0ABT2Z742_9RHOB|nr:hypothetical protein [Defluviimonas sp. WL0075]MCV2866913.1 hypothetical protein [Defluviimonas sp. WL0075]
MKWQQQAQELLSELRSREHSSPRESSEDIQDMIRRTAELVEKLNPQKYIDELVLHGIQRGLFEDSSQISGLSRLSEKKIARLSKLFAKMSEGKAVTEDEADFIVPISASYPPAIEILHHYVSIRLVQGQELPPKLLRVAGHFLAFGKPARKKGPSPTKYATRNSFLSEVATYACESWSVPLRGGYGSSVASACRMIALATQKYGMAMDEQAIYKAIRGARSKGKGKEK